MDGSRTPHRRMTPARFTVSAKTRAPSQWAATRVVRLANRVGGPRVKSASREGLILGAHTQSSAIIPHRASLFLQSRFDLPFTPDSTPLSGADSPSIPPVPPHGGAQGFRIGRGLSHGPDRRCRTSRCGHGPRGLAGEGRLRRGEDGRGRRCRRLPPGRPGRAGLGHARSPEWGLAPGLRLV
jgi:hypothetical protein